MEKINLSLVDDHPMILLGIQISLEKKNAKHIIINEVYPTGKEILDNIENTLTEVVLVDLLLPDMNGSEVIRELLILKPALKIGIYSSYEEPQEIIAAFENGALGYLSKAAGAKELVEFIEAIAQGERNVRGKIAEILIGQSKPALSKQKEVQLTQREQEIIELIIDGNKNREIAEKLCISERTVEFHRQNIYLKFKVTNVSGLIKTFNNQNKLTLPLTNW